MPGRPLRFTRSGPTAVGLWVPRPRAVGVPRLLRRVCGVARPLLPVAGAGLSDSSGLPSSPPGGTGLPPSRLPDPGQDPVPSSPVVTRPDPTWGARGLGAHSGLSPTSCGSAGETGGQPEAVLVLVTVSVAVIVVRVIRDHAVVPRRPLRGLGSGSDWGLEGGRLSRAGWVGVELGRLETDG